MAWFAAPTAHDRLSLLEFVRGALYSLSASDTGKVHAVHVGQIRSVFSALGQATLHRPGLTLLRLLGEAERLPGGYWLPSPFRVIELEHQSIFVGAVPTTLGFLGPVENEGLCRLLTPDMASTFPSQRIAEWMGTSEMSPELLVGRFYDIHKRHAIQSAVQGDVEALSFDVPRRRQSRNFYWTDAFGNLPTYHQIAVFQQRFAGRIRYFSAGVRDGGIISDAPIQQSIPRLMYALAYVSGAPAVVWVRESPEHIEITVNDPLPREEYRLALLLSREVVRQRGTTFKLSPQFGRVLIQHLNALGCVMETYQ